MSGLRVHPRGRPLVGDLAVPGDKSIGHRAVLFAALAEGRSTIAGLSGGEDNRRTVEALRALGVEVSDRPGALTITGRGRAGLRAPSGTIDCGNSGTTLRLLAGLLGPCPFGARLDGDASLRGRPMGRVAAPLAAMGARITGSAGRRPGELYPPLLVGPAPARLRGIEHRPEVASAQVKSAVLLAALAATGPTRVVEPARSRDHSERMLAAMGAPITIEDDGPAGVGAIVVEPGGGEAPLRARDLAVPGDLSSAAFLLGAALLLPGSRVVVRGVVDNPTRTGVLDALAAMGAPIERINRRQVGGEPVADLVAVHTPLRGARIDGLLALRAIDELPLLAALAAHAEGETVIADAAELRVKESDRIAAMAAALAGLGVDVEERPDGLVVRGGRVRGGRVTSRGDHRVAMASAVCALAAAGETEIEDTASIATSYPGFAAALGSLGADLDEVAGAG